ncbi:unnamed protein product [Prunus armeniaca]|uniref:Uncharacterized protein n=1 Tax=Prunus armeniaca TaxID=36596 RepID=A0A6J5W057_PRUAR|nr:unnamed protein product [Prunus armeniaca]
MRNGISEQEKGRENWLGQLRGGWASMGGGWCLSWAVGPVLLLFRWVGEEKLYNTTVAPAGVADWYYGPTRFSHVYSLYSQQQT